MPQDSGAEPPSSDARAAGALTGAGRDDRVLQLFELLGRRWALRVLWELQDAPLGFRALQARGGGISASVLARRLAELVAAGVLEQDPERRYALSADGRALTRILAQLEWWAARGGQAGSP